MQTKSFTSPTHTVEVLIKENWTITVSGGKKVLDRLTAKRQPSSEVIHYLLQDCHVSGISSLEVSREIEKMGIVSRNGRITP